MTLPRSLRSTAAATALSAAAALAGQAGAAPSTAASPAPTEWPSYNRTLTSERFSPLKAIDTANVAGLKVVCTYDTGQTLGFQTGLVQTAGAIFATTEQDTFSINPDTCAENWRVHDDTIASAFLKVNRGLAYLDGRVFRGTTDGRVLAYDAKTGKALWSQVIGDHAKGESVPASPIAWNGLVLIGNAGGDNRGVKGRMYALDAATGKIVWEFYLVPRGPGDVARGPIPPAEGPAGPGDWRNKPGFQITGGATWTSYSLDPVAGEVYVPAGNPAPDFAESVRPGDNLFSNSVVVLDARTGAYKRHFQLIRHDFHDWDVSNAPALFTSRAGKRIMALTPKDGHLYGYDLKSGKQIYRRPVTTIANNTAPLTEAGVHFCPGTQGGAEWNGAAYDRAHNLVMTGEVDWCSTVNVQTEEAVSAVPAGQAWPGSRQGFRTQDGPSTWAGWLTASNAETGAPVWRFKAPAPVMSGVTPTAGGVTFFGDMTGTLYAFDSAKGAKLWSADLGGAIGGGVITYDTGAGQKVAVAAGMTSGIWPGPKVNAKIVVLGLQ